MNGKTIIITKKILQIHTFFPKQTFIQSIPFTLPEILIGDQNIR